MFDFARLYFSLCSLAKSNICRNRISGEIEHLAKSNQPKKMAQIEVLNILATFNPMDHGNGTFALEKAVEMFYSSNCYESNVILVTNGGNIAYHKIDGIDIKIVTINKYECHENNPEECWQFRNRLPYFCSEPYKNFFS